jgi:hypothetical protein
MWFKEYRDYKTDTPLIKERVEPGHGIIGCEMHDLNGWGNEIHQPRKRKKSALREFLSRILHRKHRG